MNPLLRFLYCILALPGILSAQSALPEAQVIDFTIGQRVTFESQVLGEVRTLNVYVPPVPPTDSSDGFPVIYLLDGSADEDFIHIAGLLQFASFDWIGMAPPCILVGIGNVNRYRDFTHPTELPEYQKINPASGGADPFITFMAEEVQPYIEAHYPTAGPRTIIGQSLGGLLATQVLFQRPELFDNYLIVSPSLWWDDRSLLGAPIQSGTNPQRVFVAVGAEGRTMKRVARQLYRRLRRESGAGTTAEFEYYPELDHGDALHLSAYDGLEMIFRRE